MKGNKNTESHSNHMIAFGIIMIILVILMGWFLAMLALTDYTNALHMMTDSYSEDTVPDDVTDNTSTGTYENSSDDDIRWFPNKDCWKYSGKCTVIHAAAGSLQLDGSMFQLHYDVVDDTNDTVRSVNTNEAWNSLYAPDDATDDKQYALIGWSKNDPSKLGHSWFLDGSNITLNNDTGYDESLYGDEMYAYQIPRQCFQNIANNGNCEMAKYTGELPKGYKTASSSDDVKGVTLRSTHGAQGSVYVKSEKDDSYYLKKTKFDDTETIKPIMNPYDANNIGVNLPTAESYLSNIKYGMAGDYFIGYTIPLASVSDSGLNTYDVLYAPGQTVTLDRRNVILTDDGMIPVIAIYAEVPATMLRVIIPNMPGNESKQYLTGYDVYKVTDEYGVKQEVLIKDEGHWDSPTMTYAKKH